MSAINEYIKQWIESNNISEVECLVPDITGNARGKIVPAAKYCKEYGMRIPEGILPKQSPVPGLRGREWLTPSKSI